MKFKEKKMREQLFNAHTLLIHMAYEFEALSLKMGIEPVVTRVTDHFDGESGIHHYGKAMDFRDEFSGRLYTDKEANLICDKLNKKFKRNDGKPTCMHHSFDGGPLHFHLQVAHDFAAYKPEKPETNKEDSYGSSQSSKS